MFETIEELLKRIQQGEDSKVELKSIEFQGKRVSEPDRHKMADELAAMANTNTGVFLLGIDDKSKTILGIPDEKLDIVENWIAQICNDSITPKLFCRIEKISIVTKLNSEKNIIRVDIPKSHFVHKSPGGYYIRIGSHKRELSPDHLARLFQQRSQARIIHFDEQAVPRASPEILDKSLLSKFRKSSSSLKDDDELLRKLKLLTIDESGKLCPSISGLLMVSKEPQEFLPNAYIQAVCYRGQERNATYQIDAHDIFGPLDVQIAEAFKFVQKNMKIGAIKDPARRDIPQYEMSAIFEALVNSVAHRDYSIHGSKIRLHMFADRLELFSPGAIPNAMTIDSLRLLQISRNQLLTSLLAQCPLPTLNFDTNRQYLMDKRGEGVPIILEDSKRLSSKEPKYQLIDDSELLLTIFAAEPPHSGIN